MPEEITNEVELDGEPKLQAVRRPSIKLATKPQIVVCIPCGEKDVAEVFTCDASQGGCGKQWVGPGHRTPNLTPFQWSLNHMNLNQPLNVAMAYLVESGRLSAEARQIMTKKAIRMGAKYILYWDDDTLPPRLGLYTMHNWMERHPEVGAITAVYTTRENPPEPLVYTSHGAGAAWDFPMGPGAEPVPIFGCGAGFLLVRVQAIIETIERLKRENGGEELAIWSDGRTIPYPSEKGQRIMWGHDIRFCKVLQETGWPVYVHGEIICDHLSISTGELFTVPKDAPGFKIQRGRNINTKDYWDDIYTREGADTWRKFPKMFEKLAGMLNGNSSVVELGCGAGMLGSRLTAQNRVSKYKGYDLSEIGVEISKNRFLDADVLDVANLRISHLGSVDTVIATGLVEHVNRQVFDHMMDVITQSKAGKFIFTVPDNKYPPDEIPEYVDLFNRKLVRKYVRPYLDRWSLKMEKAGDGFHLICVMERKNGKEQKDKKSIATSRQTRRRSKKEKEVTRARKGSHGDGRIQKRYIAKRKRGKGNVKGSGNSDSHERSRDKQKKGKIEKTKEVVYIS